MKKVLVSLLALTLVLAFAACGQSADSSSTPTSSKAGATSRKDLARRTGFT